MVIPQAEFNFFFSLGVLFLQRKICSIFGVLSSVWVVTVVSQEEHGVQPVSPCSRSEAFIYQSIPLMIFRFNVHNLLHC
mgnify:CR=1 FL=1